MGSLYIGVHGGTPSYHLDTGSLTDLELARQSETPVNPVPSTTALIHTRNRSFLCGFWGFELRPTHLHSKYLYQLNHLPSLVFLGFFETRISLCSSGYP